MPTLPQKPPKGREMFVIKDGQATDAPIHEPILKGISKDDHRKLRVKSATRALAKGVPLHVVGKLFGHE